MRVRTVIRVPSSALLMNSTGSAMASAYVDPLLTDQHRFDAAGRDRGNNRVQVAAPGQTQYSGCRILGAEHGCAALPKLRLDASGIRVGERQREEFSAFPAHEHPSGGCFANGGGH